MSELENYLREWTMEEDCRILELRAEGMAVSLMAELVGRTRGSINARFERLKKWGVKLPEVKCRKTPHIEALKAYAEELAA